MHRKVFFLIFAAVLSGCAFLRPPAFPPLTGRELSPAETAALRDAAAQQAAALRSLRSLARARLRVTGGSSSFRYLVVFQKPDRLRVEIFPLTALYTQGLLVAEPGKALYLDPQTRRAVTADRAESLIYQVLRLPLTPREFANYLAGRVDPQALAAPDLRAALDPAAGMYQMESRMNGVHCLLHARDHTLAALRLVRDERVVLEITYGPYAAVKGMQLPQRLAISAPREGFSLELRPGAVSVNEDFPEKLYRADVPPGYQVQPLTAAPEK